MPAELKKKNNDHWVQLLVFISVGGEEKEQVPKVKSEQAQSEE